MEECAKVQMLGGRAIGILLGFEQDVRKFWRELARHEAKNSANAYFLGLSEEEKHARERKDWKGEGEAFDRAKRKFIKKSNRAKNAALYVDVRDGKVATTPRDSITAEMVAEIAKENERYLGLMQTDLKLLLKFGKEPPDPDFRKSLKQWIERTRKRMKQLPDEYDLRKATEDMVEELRPVFRKLYANTSEPGVNEDTP
jgi:AbiV family abortive infection protein